MTSEATTMSNPSCPRIAVPGAAETHRDVAQGAIVMSITRRPSNAAHIDSQFVAVMNVVVEHRREQVPLAPCRDQRAAARTFAKASRSSIIRSRAFFSVSSRSLIGLRFCMAGYALIFMASCRGERNAAADFSDADDTERSGGRLWEDLEAVHSAVTRRAA